MTHRLWHHGTLLLSSIQKKSKIAPFNILSTTGRWEIYTDITLKWRIHNTCKHLELSQQPRLEWPSWMETQVLKPHVPLPQRFPDLAEYAHNEETCYHAQHPDAFPAPPCATKLTWACCGVVCSHNQPLDVKHWIPCKWVPSYPAATWDPDWHGSERCHLSLCT